MLKDERSLMQIEKVLSRKMDQARSLVPPSIVKHSRWLLPIILLSYISVGFPDGAFTVAWLGIGEEMPGMGIAHTGWILVGYSVTYTLAGVLLAQLNRFMRLQTIYLVGLIIKAAGFIYLALSPNFAHVLSAVTLYGLGTGAMASSMNSYMAKHFDAGKNNWMHFFWGIGASVSPLIMGHMKTVADWRAGYWVIVSIVGVVGLVLALSIWRKVWTEDSDELDAADEATDSADAIEEHSGRRYLEGSWYRGVKVAAFFFLGGTDYTFVFFTGAVLLTRGFSLEQVALFPAVYYAFMTLARLVAGLIAKRIGETAIIRLSVLISVLGVGILYFTSNIVGMAITGFGLGALLPTLVSDTANYFRPKFIAKIVGYELAAFGAGIAVLFFLTSQIMDAVGEEMLFPLGLSFCVLVFICNEIITRAGRRLKNDAPTLPGGDADVLPTSSMDDELVALLEQIETEPVLTAASTR